MYHIAGNFQSQFAISSNIAIMNIVLTVLLENTVLILSVILFVLAVGNANNLGHIWVIFWITGGLT